jgi:GxxExxY protein
MLSLDEATEKVIKTILDSAFRVHTALGPGLLEKTYQACLAFELRETGLKVETERPLPVHYRGVTLDAGFRLDMVIEDKVIIENKAVSNLLPLHTAQIMTYLRLSGKEVGLLLNWNTVHLKDGVKRVVQTQR